MNIPTEKAQKVEREYEKEIKRLEAQLVAEREAWDKQFTATMEKLGEYMQDNKQLREQLAAAVEVLEAGKLQMSGNKLACRIFDAALAKLRELLAAERERHYQCPKCGSMIEGAHWGNKHTNIHDYLDSIGAEPPLVSEKELSEAKANMIKTNSVEEAVEIIVQLDAEREVSDGLGKLNDELQQQLATAVEALKRIRTTNDIRHVDAALKQYANTTTSNKPIRPKPSGQGD